MKPEKWAPLPVDLETAIEEILALRRILIRERELLVKIVGEKENFKKQLKKLQTKSSKVS